MQKVSQHIVTSVAEWLALPEVPYATHTVQKVGFVPVPLAECIGHGLIVTPNKTTNICYLPTTVTVDAGGGTVFYRLPLALTEWAFDVVATAQYVGKSPFPKRITFGVRDGHIYAHDAE